jgi:hypothetical protein
MSNLESIRACKRPRTLLEKYDIFRLEPEVAIGLEKLLGIPTCRPTGHDVPWHDDRADRLANFLLCDLLQARDAFRLVLE